MLRFAVIFAVILAPLKVGANTMGSFPSLSPQAVVESLRPEARTEILPNARWGDRSRGLLWTRAALSALRGHASTLPRLVPRDIDTWCPAYRKADTAQREAFWVGLLSAMAKHESTYQAGAVGGGGRWYGLLQILPRTARGYGCRARSAEALTEGSANLSCALRIMSRTVARDGVVSQDMRGVAADWGPFHSSAKRDDMMAWTKSQTYCLPTLSTRPKARPAEFP